MYLCRVLANGPALAPQPRSLAIQLNLSYTFGHPTQLSKNTYRIRHLTVLWLVRVGRPPCYIHMLMALWRKQRHNIGINTSPAYPERRLLPWLP
jgi:hypothetical protein